MNQEFNFKEEIQSYLTERELRCLKQNWEQDPNKAKDVLKFVNGPLAPKESDWHPITVEDNVLKIRFNSTKSSGCYVDDGIAVHRDILEAYPIKDEFTKEAIFHLDQAIFALDKRSVRNHGYGFNLREKLFNPPYMVEKIKDDSIVTEDKME